MKILGYILKIYLCPPIIKFLNLVLMEMVHVSNTKVILLRSDAKALDTHTREQMKIVDECVDQETDT